jgi:hypothetical protein
MMEIIGGMPENVLAVSGRGKITKEDYERVLIPALEEKLKNHEKIRMLYQLAPDFTAFTPGAMVDDAKVGIRHLTAFEKIAVVSDAEWMLAAARVFGFLIPCPVKTYANGELKAAKEWVSQ